VGAIQGGGSSTVAKLTSRGCSPFNNTMERTAPKDHGPRRRAQEMMRATPGNRITAGRATRSLAVMKNWKRWAAVGVLAVAEIVAFYPLAGYIATNSDAYAEAERFLRASSAVSDRIGSVRSVSIEPFSASLRFTTNAGDAQFNLDVEGSRSVAKAYVELQRRGSWRVHVAQLAVPGRSVEELPTK